jgi:hypothetical protein
VELWVIIFMIVILKIPVAYVGWVVWWAVKAEPEPGVEGGTEGIPWRPWRQRPPGSGRPERRSGRGVPSRSGARTSRRRERAHRVA